MEQNTEGKKSSIMIKFVNKRIKEYESWVQFKKK